FSLPLRRSAYGKLLGAARREIGELLCGRGRPGVDLPDEAAALREQHVLRLLDRACELDHPELFVDPVGKLGHAARMDAGAAGCERSGALDPLVERPAEVAEPADAPGREELVRARHRSPPRHSLKAAMRLARTCSGSSSSCRAPALPITFRICET